MSRYLFNFGNMMKNEEKYDKIFLKEVGKIGENWFLKGLRIAKEGILSLLFPRAANCLCCRDPRRAAWEDCLCDQCRADLEDQRVPPEACNRCLSPVKQGKPCSFCKSPVMKWIDTVYAPYRYGGAARMLIHAFKFDACNEALPLLADAMENALTFREFDCLVPVPLHPKRFRQRGFNQALLLCRELTRRLDIPTRELLRRTRFHRPQSWMSAEMRKMNVMGAFVCEEDIENLRVLLVDDVRTSGNTAHACAKALRKAGAGSVSLLTAAVVYRGKKK